MKIKNTACPNCKNELNPDVIDLIPKRLGSCWECKKCEFELRTSPISDLLLHCTGAFIGWLIFVTLKPFFESKNHPMPFFYWCILLLICGISMSLFWIVYNYFAFKIIMKK